MQLSQSARSERETELVARKSASAKSREQLVDLVQKKMPRDDNDDERSRKLFVGGLDYDTTDGKLESHFSQWGELTDFVVMKFPDTRRSRGFGFITFATKDQLEDCMQAAPHTLDGKTVELKRATPREDDRSGGGRGGGGGPNIFVNIYA